MRRQHGCLGRLAAALATVEHDEAAACHDGSTGAFFVAAATGHVVAHPIPPAAVAGPFVALYNGLSYDPSVFRNFGAYWNNFEDVFRPFHMIKKR